MTKYARGRSAYGQCAKSGRRMLLKDMVIDGYTKLLVDPDWKEPPEMVYRTYEDGEALVRPTTDLDAANIDPLSDESGIDLITGLPVGTVQ